VMAATSNAAASKHSIRFMCSPYEFGWDYKLDGVKLRRSYSDITMFRRRTK
jgi:hypothetical protein